MKEKILELRALGKTYSEIQAETGCSKSTISYYCGSGQKEKSLQRGRDRRSQVVKYIQKVKSETPCADCGENYPYWMKDFDHLGDKSFTIADHRKSRAGLEIVKKEIAKCEVVCRNCHADRTHKRLVKSASDVLEYVVT